MQIGGPFARNIFFWEIARPEQQVLERHKELSIKMCDVLKEVIGQMP
jgi:hypothetical protein